MGVEQMKERLTVCEEHGREAEPAKGSRKKWFLWSRLKFFKQQYPDDDDDGT